MKKIMKIGIVGCGAIGTSLAKIISARFRGKAVLSAVYDIDALKAERLLSSGKIKAVVCKDLKILISKSDLVIEAASAGCSFEIAEESLSRGRDVIVMSVGGIVEGFDKLSGIASRRGCRLYVPSGAISGIDALKAAGMEKVDSVTITTIKPPQSFRSVKYVIEKNIDLASIRKDTVLFEGNAVEAMKYFPQNINVAGILSLAGIGAGATRVRIVASPAAARNVHEVSIESSAGKIITRTENVIHPENPKTSYLAVLSAGALLKQILEPARIGT